jgi:ParB-like chromosome segregation protein Spo0J
MVRGGPGRPQVFCKASCKQRDYEARRRAAELGLGEHELVVTRAELDSLRDRLYVLACVLEDVQRDLERGDIDERSAVRALASAAKECVGAS